MATRTISTKLAITGESEYRSSLSRINQELKTLQSSLKLTESQYQSNANSMQALQAKGNDLRALYDAQKKKVDELRNAYSNAQRAQTEWADKISTTKQKIAENDAALEKLKKTTGDTTAEQKRLEEEGARLRDQLKNEEAGLAAAEKGTMSWKQQLNNAEIQLNDLDAELQKNDKYLDEAKNSTDGCAHSIDEFGREVKESSDELKTMGTILASEELRQGMEKVINVLKDCVSASGDFQEQMAKVRSTTGMSESEIQALGARFKELSTEIPVTTSEMAKIAAAAGQFGIANDQIENFTVSMARLASASDTSADSIASLLAQFSNITGEKDFERLASVITRLNYNSATSAENIIQMSQGLAAAGKIAGMSATDILAISAAVTSLGQGSQSGSTAMQRLIIEMQKSVETGEKLKEFASISGMSVSQFKKAWGEDAVGALAAFVEGLSDTERNGQTALSLLDELGISSQREIAALLGLSEADLSLTDAVAMVNDEWEKNTALTEAASIKGETLNAKLTEMDSAANNLKIAVGDALAPALTAAAEGATDMIKGITGFVEKHPELTAALSTVAGGLAAITTAIATVKAAYKAADFLGMTGAFEKIGTVLTEATGGFTSFGAALETIGLAGGTVASVLLSVYSIGERVHDLFTGGLIGEGHDLEDYRQNVENMTVALERAQAEYNACAASGADLTMAQDALDLATSNLYNAQKELTEAEKAAGEAAQEAANSQNELTGAYDTATYTMEAARDDIQAVAEAYKEAYNAAHESIHGQIGLFDDYAASISEDTDTAQELLQRWAEQTANLDQYTRNLDLAAQYGLDEGLVQSLADGSTESAGYLQTIIQEIQNAENGLSSFGSSADEVVDQFNSSFERTQQAQENLALTVAAIETGVGEALASIKSQLDEDTSWDEYFQTVSEVFANAGVDFEGFGGNLIEGLAQGIRGSDDAVSAIHETDDAINEAIESDEQMHSPSQKFAEYGRNLDEGLAQGIDEGTPGVVAAIDSMAEKLNSTMEETGLKASDRYIDGFKQINAKTEMELQGLKSTLDMGTMGMYDQMFGIGSNIVFGMIQGIYSQSGYLYDAVYNVVSSAISAARSAAAVASPSKKTKEIFENVGEGMVVGIESKKDRVERATQNVVDKALKIDTSAVEKIISASNSGNAAVLGMLSQAQKNSQASEKSIGYIDVHIDMSGSTIRSDEDIDRLAERMADRMSIELGRLTKREVRAIGIKETPRIY